MDWEKRMRKVEHPVRVAIIDALRNNKEPMPLTDIARAVGQPVSNCSYHINALIKFGDVKALESTAPRMFEFVNNDR